MTFILRLPLRLLTLTYQSVFLALGQIWTNKLRALLTTLGIVIGVSSVVAVIAALSGLRKSVLSEFETLGTNKVFVMPARPDRGPLRNANFNQVRFEPELFDDMLLHTPSLDAFTRQTSFTRTVRYGEVTEENVEVTGIEPSWHKIENRSVTIGRPFGLIDVERANAVCLIDPKMQDKLRLPRDPTGQSILIGNRWFLIIGVVEPRVESSMFRGGGSEAEVFIPFTTAYQGGRGRLPLYVIAAAKAPNVAEEARAEIAFYLRNQRRLKPGEPDTFRIEFVDRFVQQFNQLAVMITMVATGIVGISLLVGGVGIMNIMLVSVSERTREIGLRKAIGARPAAILLQFLIEAMVLCFMGGLIGVLIGQGLVSLIASVPQMRLQDAFVPTWAVVQAHLGNGSN
ncbi:MAG TPA: ABC transporter permease, partial [Tepidisphaeraceae bacterium]|nr:ABC transporter permease [Tepidisphaeraceae bacterium]